MPKLTAWIILANIFIFPFQRFICFWSPDSISGSIRIFCVCGCCLMNNNKLFNSIKIILRFNPIKDYDQLSMKLNSTAIQERTCDFFDNDYEISGLKLKWIQIIVVILGSFWGFFCLSPSTETKWGTVIFRPIFRYFSAEKCHFVRFWWIFCPNWTKM